MIYRKKMVKLILTIFASKLKDMVGLSRHLTCAGIARVILRGYAIPAGESIGKFR